MTIKPSDLVQMCGINRTYAWQLWKGKREPSLELALQIYDKTGEQFGKLKELSPDEIEVAREALRTIGSLAA